MLNFGANGMHLKFTVAVNFQAQFTVGKQKILLKTKNFAKTASLGIINNVSHRSQQNQRIFGNLSLNTFCGPKLDVNCHHGSVSFTNSHIVYNRTTHLYFLDVKFQLFRICRFRLQPKETARFFSSGPILAHFWFFWGQ